MIISDVFLLRSLFLFPVNVGYNKGFQFLLSEFLSLHLRSSGWVEQLRDYSSWPPVNYDFLIGCYEYTHELLADGIIIEEMRSHLERNLQLDTGNTHHDSLFIHCVEVPSPVSVKVTVFIDRSCVCQVFGDCLQYFIEISLKSINKSLNEEFLIVPMLVETLNSKVKVVVILSIHFSMDVNVEKRKVFVYKAELVQSLMKG